MVIISRHNQETASNGAGRSSADILHTSKY